jgi:2-polyprenyl-3-methyl-5-hydroxy-6-metoxy-1,4-benzoquinol methylase
VTKPNRSLTTLEEERIVPWGEPGLVAWHLARYRFALPIVAGKRVMDFGCGEGYGSALLAERAGEVVGVDYSPAAVRHASSTYVRRNLRFQVGDAAALDASLGRFDVITCFEVLEHVEDQDAVLARFAVLLDPAGKLVLSTPNMLVEVPFERFVWGEKNEYHVGLLSPAELRRRLRRHFRSVRLYGQTPAGNAVHLVLKTLDVFNLRHRLVHSLRVQRRLAEAVMGQSWNPDAMSFRFSRLLVRQSPITIAVAEVPQHGQRRTG